MGRTVAGVVVVLGLCLGAGALPAVAEPGEDGAVPAATGWFDDTPLGGWRSGAATDRVHDIAQIGSRVYVAGTFTTLRSPTGALVTRRYLAAFDATTGALLTTFNPVLNGAVYSLAVAPDGSRLYAAGAFTTVNGATRQRVVSLNPTSGGISTGWTAYGASGTVRSIVRYGNHLYLGGGFLGVNGVVRTRLARLSATTGAVDPTWNPRADGNAVLTIEVPRAGGRLYVGGRFTSLNGQAIGFLGAVDLVSGATVGTFAAAQPGREVYDLLADDDGRVYVAEGGFLGRAEAYAGSNGARVGRWDVSGDVQAVERIGDRIWFGGHNFGPGQDQEVGIVDPADLRTFDVQTFSPPLTGGDGVWAFHSSGATLWLGSQSSGPYNGFGRYAATSPPPAPPPASTAVELVPAGTTWRLLDDGSEQFTAWRQLGFNDSTWRSGRAQLGFGDGDEATTVASGWCTYWFRHGFSVVGASTIRSLNIELLVDDGAIVYLNGVELARDNMPSGSTNSSTRASSTRFDAAERTWRTFTAPASALVEGMNVLAIEVHQDSLTSSDLSMDARLVGVR